MSATGIGAAVRRKEDQRFITGKGHYTADLDLAGQAHAVFVRSPHAHARIRAIDTKAAAAMPDVLAVLTGAELAADKIGNLICGWMIHSKDGSPMKMAPHPALAHGKACHVGDPVAVVIGRTVAAAKDAAENVTVDYEVLPAVADPAKAQAPGAPLIHEGAPRNTIYQWHLGDAKAVDAAFKSARRTTRLDIVNNRLVPNAIEPRAAIGEYDAGSGGFTLWNTTQNPHVARLVISAFRRGGARREQAARDRARRGRRLRLEDLHLSGRGGGAVGVKARRRAGEIGFRPRRGVPLRRARPRPRHPCRDGLRRGRPHRGAAGEDDRESRRLHVHVLVVSNT